MYSKTAQKVLDFYGGEALWKKAQKLEATVSVKGLAFTLKRRPFFVNVLLEMDLDKPFCSITPIGKDKNIKGILRNQDVYLENDKKEILAERKNGRKYFPYGRRLFWWDDLDMAYFANYAFWNYFSFPRLLMREDIAWKEKEAGVLEAIFPDTIPSHCRVQEFYFDKESGQLLEHHYTANIISKLAKVVHTVGEHENKHGLRYAKHRIVRPRDRKGKAMKGPVMIDISVHDMKLS